MADIIPFPVKKQPRIIAAEESRYAIFRAVSDSMAPTIAAGDIVEIDEACNAIHADGIFVVDVAGSPAIRRVQLLPFADRVRLYTDAAPDVAEVTDPAQLRVVGRVTRYWTERRA